MRSDAAKGAKGIRPVAGAPGQGGGRYGPAPPARGTGRDRGMAGAVALGPVVDGLLARLGLATQARRHQVMQQWAGVVGPVIAARARPYRLTGDVLWVAVSHPGWAQELAFLKGKIVEDLNAAAGAPVVRDVRFTAGPRRGWPAAPPGAGGGEGPGSLPGAFPPEPEGPDRPGWDRAGPTTAGSPATAGIASLPAEAAGQRHLHLPGETDLHAAVTRWLGAARRRRMWALKQGWRPCRACGSLYPPAPGAPREHPAQDHPAAGRRPGRTPLPAPATPGGELEGLCPACRASQEERLRQRVRAILERDPWLSCQQVAGVVGRPPAAVARLYREEWAALQDRWRARLRFLAARLRQGEPPPPETRSLLLRYALLRTGREPAELTPAEAREAVGSRLAALWDACFGEPSPGHRPRAHRPRRAAPGDPAGGHRAGARGPAGGARREGPVGEGRGEGT